jgi:GST-like protein
MVSTFTTGSNLLLLSNHRKLRFFTPYIQLLHDNESGMEVQRLCSVLDQHLATRGYLLGEQFTIADMAVYPWIYVLLHSLQHASSGTRAREFLSMDQYTHLGQWAERIGAKPGVQRGMQVCHSNGQGKPWLHEQERKA